MKAFIYLILLIICFVSTNSELIAQIQDSVSITPQADTVQAIIPLPQSPTNRIDSLIRYAFSLEGKKYQYGGNTLTGFDCSGYTMTVFAHFGLRLPHTSAGQSLIGVQVPISQIAKGDLIFFRGRNATQNRVGHVGLVISEHGEPVQFIHSSTTAGVRVDRLDAPYYKKRYVKTMRTFTHQ
jgi:cell wall-associated NlpC family hydrolase